MDLVDSSGKQVSIQSLMLGTNSPSIARGKVAERFAIDEKKRVERQDMLQSFIRHGLNEEEAVSESLIQM